MKKFITLTVAFTTTQTRKELINMGHVVRIIDGSGGTMLCFNSSGSDYIIVKESSADIESLLK